MNHLEAFCIGLHLVPFINGKKTLKAQASYCTAGEAGLIAGAYGGPGMDIIFDNFMARKP
ncbi:MAG: hypothetical protein IT308_01310 [Anaerolineaceae bacterium]|nr:hypothetical protein [Anaerolineaceae bacterium]